jgi:putative ABC transport system ATP-binding protein
MATILNIQNLGKTYQSAGRELTVLENINFSVEAGSTMAIVGPSGSGKTTLLGLAAGLDRSTTGSVELNNIKLDQLNEDQRAAIRNQHVGFIFQSFQLLPTLTALENVMVPLELRGEKNIKSRAVDLLQKVGLGNRGHHYPAQLSGGEQQRVSMARAFINKPQILFTDEPTGNLDSANGEEVMKLLSQLNEEGTTIIMVTHSPYDANYAHRIINLFDGKVVTENIKEQFHI